MDKETAREVHRLLQEASHKLDQALQVVMDNCDRAEFERFRTMIGRHMGEIYLDMICPIYEQYEDLMPDELK